MPPLGADPAFGTFKNDPRLTQQEIDTVVAWADNGAPKGDDADLPARPQFVDGWTIGQPDLVATMEEEFQIPESGTIPYRYFKVPTALTEDRWIQAIEIKPGARSHMHVRGKDMIYIAHYADGTTETLLSVPKYDFSWQITYELAKPKLLPAGTELEVIAHYDNSANNRFNPDPSKDVRWGDQTWEEMMIGFYGTVIDRPAATQER